MSKYLKNSAVYVIPSILSSVLPLISLPIFTRILTTEDFGALAMCQVYSIFIIGISNFGLSFGYERNFFEFKNKEKQIVLLYSTIFFVTITSLISGIITYLFLENIILLLKISIDYSNELLLSTFLAAFLINTKSYFLIFFKNNENAKEHTNISVSELIMNFIFSLIFIVIFKVGVTGIVLAQILSITILLLILIFKFYKIKSFEIDFNSLKDSIVLSYPLTPRLFFGIVGNQFDKFIIGIANSLDGLGIYSIGQRISNLGLTISTSIQNVWGPVVYKEMFAKNVNSSKIIGDFLHPFYYFTVLVFLSLSLFSEELVYIFTTNDYYDASYVISIFSILYCSYFFNKQNQLIFNKKTALISLLTLIGIVLNIAINYSLVFKFGFIGVALGTTISGLISVYIFYYFSQRSFKIIWKKNTGISLFYLIVSTLIIILIKYLGFTYSIKLLIKLLLLVIFISIGFITGAINLKVIKNEYFKIKKSISY